MNPYTVAYWSLREAEACLDRFLVHPDRVLFLSDTERAHYGRLCRRVDLAQAEERRLRGPIVDLCTGKAVSE